MPAVPPSADRNLLFGVLALQMEFVTRDGLVAGMHAWALDKSTPLGEILVRQGALRPDLRALLEPLVDRHAELHGDPGRSLASLSVVSAPDLRALAEVADPDVRASLMQFPTGGGTAAAASAAADPAATRGMSMLLRGAGEAGGLRFRVLRPHAKGGLGEVFVARDAEANREVALKEILAHAAADPEARARFLFEAEVTAGLEHPGVVPVYGLGTYPDGRPYYAMRFIRGDSLAEAIERFHGSAGAGLSESERNLELRRLLGRFVSVCQTIAYAHNRGVLHRDLKPGNVMLGRHGETLVVDWGLAKVIGRPDSQGPSSGVGGSGTATKPGGSGLDEGVLNPASSGIDELVLVPSSGGSTPTMAGRLLGTPAYMSPEQAEGRLDLVGPASDVYGLGATLYQLLTGRTPVEGNDLGELLRRVRTGEFPSPREVTPAVPKPLDAICRKALALRPGDRYVSAADLGADVERYLADEPVAALPEGRFERWSRWTRRNRMAVRTGMVAALVLFTGVFVAERWYQRDQAERAAEAATRAADAKALAEDAREDVEESIGDAAVQRDSGRWEAARRILAAAGRRLKVAADPALAERVRVAGLGVTAAEAFEEVRLETADWRGGGFHVAPAVGRDGDYAKAFEAYLEGLKAPVTDFWRGDPAAIARTLAASDIEPQIVAALDAWSWREGMHSAENERRILDLVRRIDPDPFRTRLRDPGVFTDPAALEKLAAEYDPRRWSAETANVLGNRLRLLGRTAEAADLWRRAAAEHPDDSWLHLNLGLSLWKTLGQPLEASGHFLVAVAVRPVAAAYSHLGGTLLDLKRPAAAEVAFRKAIELEPGLASARLGLGKALVDLGRSEEGEAERRRALELDPELGSAETEPPAPDTERPPM